jgi:hypothetical protein
VESERVKSELEGVVVLVVAVLVVVMLEQHL